MIYFLSQSVKKMIKDYIFAENKQINNTNNKNKNPEYQTRWREGRLWTRIRKQFPSPRLPDQDPD